MKKGTAKRVLALLICVLMAVSMLPTVAMAEEVMDDTIDGSTETYTTYENEDDSNVAALDDEGRSVHYLHRLHRAANSWQPAAPSTGP